MRILELPASNPEKFGSKRVHRGRDKNENQEQQLNLFTSGKVLQLHSLSPFEEALMVDERGDKASARELYLKAIEIGDQTADSYCNLGILESQNGNLIKAIDYLTLSLKYNPRHFEAHFNLANAYVEAGNFELGILHYEVAIEVEPSFLNSYFNLGLALASAREYQRSIVALEKYCRLTLPKDHKPALDMIQKLRNMLNGKPKSGR